MSCLAEGVGMDDQEIDEAKLALTEACANAIRHGSPRGAQDQVLVTFRAAGRTLRADVTDMGLGITPSADSDIASSGLGTRLMLMLADKVQFIKHRTGMTVRLTKRAKGLRSTRRITPDSAMDLHRN
jgi:serine/threonine-protein kinase RsbW